MTLHDVRTWLAHILAERPPTDGASALAPTTSELADAIAALRAATEAARVAQDQRVMYCPRCCQHLPGRAFRGHVSTIWATVDLWPPHAGLTGDVVGYRGPAAPCPGGLLVGVAP